MRENNKIKIALFSSRYDNLPDDQLSEALYSELLTDKRVARLFSNTLGVKSLDSFVEFVSDHGRIVVPVFYDDRLASIGWLDSIYGRNARIHFATMGWSYGGVNMLTCRAALCYLFDNNLFDSILGCTPVKNTLALRFIKKLGFVEIGVVPMSHYEIATGKSLDAMFTYCTADTLLGGNVK